jgi:fatty acid desaturase
MKGERTMKDLRSFGWYASRITPHLPKEVFKPVPSRLILGFVYLMITISGFLFIGLFDLHPLLSLGISLILGFSFASMGFLGHEILHGTVVKTPWLRDFLGAIAFWPLSTGPKLWRMWHNSTHHVHTQDEDLDPDSWWTMKRLANSKFLRGIYRLPFQTRALISFISLSFTFTLHSTKMFKRFIKQFKPENRPIVWLQFILPWTLWISLLFIMGPAKWFFAFLLPVLIANFIVMSYISTNHRLNPLTPVNDPLANSLTVTVPKWVDFLHFNFSYHTEHHLFPSISPKHYPLVKKHIKEMWPERYHEMPLLQALASLYKTPRVYFEEKELIDPKSGKMYGSLGHGLDPNKINPRTTLIETKENVLNGISIQKKLAKKHKAVKNS